MSRSLRSRLTRSVRRALRWTKSWSRFADHTPHSTCYVLTCHVLTCGLSRATCHVLHMGNSMTSRQFVLVFTALISLVAADSQAQGKRPLNVDDVFNVQDVRDPQRSPDGLWVAYTVTRAIKDTDKNDTDIWMVKWDGSEQVQ